MELWQVMHLRGLLSSGVDLDLTIERPCVDIREVVLSTYTVATLQLMNFFFL